MDARHGRQRRCRWHRGCRDRPGRGEGVVAAFAVDLPIGWIGGKYSTSNPMARDARQRADNIGEIAVMVGKTALAAWKNFMPAGEGGIQRFGIDGDFR